MLDNWRLLSVIAIGLWGLWGFLAKIALHDLNWATAQVYVVGTHFALIALAVAPRATWGWDKRYLIAVLAGLCSGLGSIVFYKAMSRGPASVVIPVTAQYVLFTAFLSFAFLGEPVVARKVIGLILGAIAVALLTS